MEYLIHLAILVGIYTILAQSLNLCFGLGGLFNLAHVASYAIGAYTTALLSTEFGLSLWYTFPASIVLGSILALPIAAISSKLTQDYFAIGTLAFSFVIVALLINWKSLTRGVLGIPGIPRPEILGVNFYENSNFLILTVLVATAAQLILALLFQSRFARGLKAQAEYEEAALSLARNTRRIRGISFFISAGYAGLAGSLFAYYINYIDPSSFSLTEMVFVLTIVVVGKPGSFWGVLGATFFLVLLPEPLRFLDISPSILGPMRQLLYAVILYGVVFFNRYKIFPLQRVI
ncbi:branched-chain amino acid ABC transporter permease [bacterium]|nr:branched-chain amino acid ABC transporter permease [bacterium]